MDGVLELAPFPYRFDLDLPPLKASSISSSLNLKSADNKPQGILRVHKLPVSTERGCGSGAGNDLAFLLSRKDFAIVPYHLPPMEGDSEAQQGDSQSEAGFMTKEMQF